MSIVQTITRNAMMCPNTYHPLFDSVHALRNRMLDAFDEGAEKDDDGEFISEPVSKAYSAAAYGDRAPSDYMRLYRETASAIDAGQSMFIDTWWWRCGTCGLILPATARPTSEVMRR